MKMKVQALVLQTWFDISLQYTGSVVNAYAIADANNLSITDEIIAGEQLIIPTELSILKKEVVFFERKKIVLASGINSASIGLPTKPTGIGAMIIEQNFIVS